jgi:site-specific recombinase XerD
MEPLIERNNYLLINEYLDSLTEETQIARVSVERYRCYLQHLLFWAMETPFSQADKIRPTLLVYLCQVQTSQRKPLAQETRKKIIELSRKFFEWAKIYHAAEFKTLPPLWLHKLKFNKKHTGQVDQEPLFVELEEVIRLVTTQFEASDLAGWRDRAMAARLFLSGERASAAVSSPISAIDFNDYSLKQWTALGVKTKNSKSATTFLLRISELIEIARTWDEYVRENLPPTAAWYAPIASQWGEQTLSENTPGENRHVALNKRLRLLYLAAGLSYKSAHKFRHGHAAYGLMHCQTMADYKALSLNLMHESLETTDRIYVHLAQKDLRTRIARLADQMVNQPDDELRGYLNRISPTDRMKAINILSETLLRENAKP